MAPSGSHETHAINGVQTPLAGPTLPLAQSSRWSVAMCPMRVWLLFFSGLVAAYLAWTSKLFGEGPRTRAGMAKPHVTPRKR